MPKYKLGSETKLAAVRYKGRTLTHQDCVDMSKNDAAALRKAGYDVETCKKEAKEASDAVQVEEAEDGQQEGEAEVEG